MTAQIHEKLILEGKETSMAFCPPIPTDHPRITASTSSGLSSMSACWRGYIGTWELKDGRFYLVSVNGMYLIDGSDPIFADWFTGVIRIPDGEILHYIHMGFGSVFEFETHLKIEKGIVVEERRIDNHNKDIDHDELEDKSFPNSYNQFDGDDL